MFHHRASLIKLSATIVLAALKAKLDQLHLLPHLPSDTRNKSAPTAASTDMNHQAGLLVALQLRPVARRRNVARAACLPDFPSNRKELLVARQFDCSPQRGTRGRTGELLVSCLNWPAQSERCRLLLSFGHLHAITMIVVLATALCHRPA